MPVSSKTMSGVVIVLDIKDTDIPVGLVTLNEIRGKKWEMQALTLWHVSPMVYRGLHFNVGHTPALQ